MVHFCLLVPDNCLPEPDETIKWHYASVLAAERGGFGFLRFCFCCCWSFHLARGAAAAAARNRLAYPSQHSRGFHIAEMCGRGNGPGLCSSLPLGGIHNVCKQHFGILELAEFPYFVHFCMTPCLAMCTYFMDDPKPMKSTELRIR